MIHLRDVRKSYPAEGSTAPVLSLSDWRIASGERVALVGRSGSGKTTLLNLLSGLVKADAGSIEIDGHDLCRMSEAARDRFRAQSVGYMFQSFHLLGGFSALENVELGASFARRRADRAEARRLLEEFGLHDRLHHLPGQLSIGQQARVALARALVGGPRLVLADEPTGALDGATADTIQTMLLEQAARLGTTLVVATHDPKVAAAFDRVVRVEDLA